MPSHEATGTEVRNRPYTTLQEDPRYKELKRIIDELPPEKIKKLESYIKKWSQES